MEALLKTVNEPGTIKKLAGWLVAISGGALLLRDAWTASSDAGLAFGIVGARRRTGLRSPTPSGVGRQTRSSRAGMSCRSPSPEAYEERSCRRSSW
jgi:hypothetical protein